MDFAIIETGGKQYKVAVGDKLKIEKVLGEKGTHIAFDKVLLSFRNREVAIGTPYLENARVEANVLAQGRARKKTIFRYHSKTRYRKKKGHRQPYTEVEIMKL